MGTHVVLVNAQGQDGKTTFPTAPGTEYEIRVAGTYSYNGRDGLADCGHYQPEGEGGEWRAYQALYVDDAPAPCFHMPLDPLHVYRWRVVGTGSPMTFRVHDFGERVDNVGHLVITMTKVSDG